MCLPDSSISRPTAIVIDIKMVDKQCSTNLPRQNPAEHTLHTLDTPTDATPEKSVDAKTPRYTVNLHFH